MQFSRRSGLGIVAALLVALTLPSSRSAAAEPMRAMVEGLSARGYFDTAVEYLETLKTNPVITDDIKRTLTYEQGLVFIHAGTAISDDALKVKQFTEASKRMAEFVQVNPQSELVAGANNQIASIFLMRGRVKTETALRQPENKDKLVAEARNLLGEARKRFEAAEQDLQAQAKKLPLVCHQVNFPSGRPS